MSEVLNELARSKDPVDQELARALRKYQNLRSSRGLNKSVGYEPRDIVKYGSIGVIERRIRKMASGFDAGSYQDSYEAIVLRHQERFDPEVVKIARARISEEEEAFKPTSDPRELDRQVRRLLDRSNVPLPLGQLKPKRVDAATSSVFVRDARVKAYVLKRAGGRCEACNVPAPFRSKEGIDYLEVHHMKPLAEGGSDRVQNAVALCPNCHRALHLAFDNEERADVVYNKVGAQLIRE